jgi:F0F1-type ATP synthase assembly protein I
VRVARVDSNRPKAPPDAERKPLGNEYFRYAGAGMQFALTFLAFGACGWWLDGRLGTAPWLMIAGILLGAAGAFYSLVRQVGPARRAPSARSTDDQHDDSR